MRKRKKNNLIVTVMVLMLLLFETAGIYQAAQASTGNQTQSAVNTLTVKNNTEFYKAMSSCILRKSAVLQMNAIEYSKNKYNEYSAINAVMKNNPKLAFVISSLSKETTLKGNNASLILKFQYIDCTYVAKDIREFYISIGNAFKQNKSTIAIRINNYTKDYSLNSYNAFLKKSGAAAGYVNGQSRLMKMKYLDSAACVITFAKPMQKMVETGNNNIAVSSSAAIAVNKNTSMNLPLPASVSEISSQVKAALINGYKQIVFNKVDLKKMSFEKLNRIVDDTIASNREYCYFNGWSKSFSTLGNTGTYKVEFKLYYSEEKVRSMEKFLKTRIKQILAEILCSDMNDYEKELAIHDYIVEHTKYDYDNFQKNTIPNESYLAYGILVNGKGVCVGYAKAFKRLMNEAGLECIMVEGNAQGVVSGPHTWNIVKIENEYYHVDATFDDPIIKGVVKNDARHTYFNLSDKEISKDHKWDGSKYPSCSSNNFSFKENKSKNR